MAEMERIRKNATQTGRAWGGPGGGVMSAWGE